MKPKTLNDFPLQSYDKIRYADTDRQGHVNNAVFSTFFETGRAELLLNTKQIIFPAGTSYVIAALNMNYLKEIHWPGKVDIGTGIIKIGSSSIKIFQQLFQDEICVADSETVIVQMNDETGKSKPLSNEAREIFSAFLLEGF